MTKPSSERRAEARAAAGFLASAASALALAAVYWAGGQPQLEGLFLAGALFGLAFGLATWGRKLVPQAPVLGERHEMRSDEDERKGVEEDFDRGGGFSRRRLLTRTAGLAVGALGLAAVFPLRSLGSRPRRALLQTPWAAGLRLVTEDGRPVRAEEVPVEGLLTVFPDGHPESADGQALLIRVSPGLLASLPGRKDWAPRDFVAYSKVCTHAGCPVGLYQSETHQLLCPCHQSAFDVLRGARPVFGPAAAPLPQLPLQIDDGGFLVAGGDFSEPVGPAFWRRG